jgi:hypothetical protein
MPLDRRLDVGHVAVVQPGLAEVARTAEELEVGERVVVALMHVVDVLASSVTAWVVDCGLTPTLGPALDLRHTLGPVVG